MVFKSKIFIFMLTVYSIVHICSFAHNWENVLDFVDCFCNFIKAWFSLRTVLVTLYTLSLS